MSSINLCESHIKVIRALQRLAHHIINSVITRNHETIHDAILLFRRVPHATVWTSSRQSNRLPSQRTNDSIASYSASPSASESRAVVALHCVCAQLHRVQVAPRCRCRRSVSFLSFFSHSARRAIRAIRLSSIRAASVSASAAGLHASRRATTTAACASIQAFAMAGPRRAVGAAPARSVPRATCLTA